jgi:diguanylate cyclase
LVEDLAACTEQRDTYLSSVRALLTLILDFSLDISELDPARFKKGMGDLSERFAQEQRMRTLASVFSRSTKVIQSYARDQKRHVTDREAELKDIIEILTKGMAGLNHDNKNFTDTLYAHGEKIERISALDDIKQLKLNLQEEITHFRKAVAEKQAQDEEKAKSLAQKVSSLNVELEQVKTESMTDGLTQLYNRKAFDGFISQLVARNSVERRPFSLLIMDVDNFKVVNDTYGHQTGDRILMALAAKCREHVRNEDFCARYGGEEFVIILPGASLRNAHKKAKKICKAVAEARYEIDFGGEGVQIGFTISVGVSSYTKDDTVASVVKRADRALYQAKASGKNKAVSEKELTG